MQRIGLLTSGGDSPGMNACIRAVVRTAIYRGLKVIGIMRGYHGLVYGQFRDLKSHSVSNIIQRGGTILKTARCEEFKTKEGREKAYNNLKNAGIEGIIVIGGDGSFRGANIFSNEYNIPVIGVPGTIDNDIYGTDYTVGYDTALNTVIEAVDKIRDTASSHDRLFLVEVMGRDAGFIALQSAIAVGAEAVVIPETKTSVNQLINLLESGFSRKKASSIIIVAEGDEFGAVELAKQITDKFSYYDTRVTILGHIQRGGSPSCFDRVLASRLGVAAVEALLDGRNNVMVGLINNEIQFTPFTETVKRRQVINEDFLRIVKILSV